MDKLQVFFIKGAVKIQDMGQQIALQQKSQQIQEQVINTSRSYTTNSDMQYVPKQGILKISINPFPYATRIGSTINGLPIYAEKSRNLQEQKKERKKIMNFFTQNQMKDLIESTVYTLANYEQQNIVYKDVSSENIFLTKSHQKNQNSSKFQFKLLPNPLIQESIYERLRNMKNKTQQDDLCSFNFSPEMIIACRAHQKQFNDLELLKKSNVFSLGMVFLEAATLRTSKQFYDQKTFDIFESAIQESLADVQARYGPTIVTIIANMIDFDFEERIQNVIELAKWIISELENMQNQEEIEKQNGVFSPQFLQSPKNLIHVPFHKKKEIQEIQQQVEMMPVCHKKVQQDNKLINSKSKLILQESHADKQNKSQENKIKITVREVPVYLQKNSRVKNGKQNKERLMYSPFASTMKSNQYSSYERAKLDLLTNTKRSLAFQETTKISQNLFKELKRPNNIPKSQR